MSLPRLHVQPLEALTRDEWDSVEFFTTPGRAEKAVMWFKGRNPYSFALVKVDSAHWRKLGSDYGWSRYLHILRDYTRFTALYESVVRRQEQFDSSVARLDALWGAIIRDAQKRILQLGEGEILTFHEASYTQIPTVASTAARLHFGHACCSCGAILDAPQVVRPGQTPYWQCVRPDCNNIEIADSVREFTWLDIVG